jgi:hypothetical protein
MDFNDYEFEQRLRTMGGDFLPQRRDAPAPQASGCLSEANPKGLKGPRGAEEMEVILCCFSGWDKNIYERMH